MKTADDGDKRRRFTQSPEPARTPPPTDRGSMQEGASDTPFSRWELPELKGDCFCEKDLRGVMQKQMGTLHLTRRFVIWTPTVGKNVLLLPLDLVDGVDGGSSSLRVTMKPAFEGASDYSFATLSETRLVQTVRALCEVYQNSTTKVIPSELCAKEAKRDRKAPDASPTATDDEDAGSGAPEEYCSHSGSEAEAISELQYSGDCPADIFAPLDLMREGKDSKMIMKAEIAGASLAAICKLLAHDPSFLQAYHTERKDEEFTVNPWTRSGNWGGVRMTQGKVSTPMGIKMMYEGQRFICLPSIFMFHMTSQVPDVTYGGSFRCQTLYTYDLSGGTVTQRIDTCVTFTEKVFVQGMIRKRALQGLEPAGQIFTKVLRSKIGRGSGSPEVSPPPGAAARADAAAAESVQQGDAPAASPRMAVAALFIGLLVGACVGLWFTAGTEDPSRAALLASLGTGADSLREPQQPSAYEDTMRVAAALAPREVVQADAGQCADTSAAARVFLEALKQEIARSSYLAATRFALVVAAGLASIAAAVWAFLGE